MHNEIKIDDTSPMPGCDRGKNRKLQFEWLKTQPERQILQFLVNDPMGGSHTLPERQIYVNCTTRRQESNRN